MKTAALAHRSNVDARPGGFTLVEMLVVIGIIGILLSMLLASLNRSTQKSREIQCINNVRQLGLAARMLWMDNANTYSRVSGGVDPLPGCLEENHGIAVERNLYAYIGPSSSFRCPSDRGKISEDCMLHPETTLLPSCWETRGFSYELNVGTPVGLVFPFTLKTNAGSIVGEHETWITDPARFILFHEPTAKPQVCHHIFPHFAPRWYQWHRNRGITEFLDPRLAPPRFFSPVAFADGHAEFLDFTRSLTANPYYPFEETKEWMWYMPWAGP